MEKKPLLFSARCQVEGFAYTPDSKKPEYRVTQLEPNVIFKHCPEEQEGGVDVTPELRHDYENILCKYNLSQGTEQAESLCPYLSGAGLFCPELQGVMYNIGLDREGRLFKI
uniref:Uncharacterized protein n=1 Tax=Cacopsylla melanoneura TaxID=428564 RepID=A0A8D8QJK2_9HEMI